RKSSVAGGQKWKVPREILEARVTCPRRRRTSTSGLDHCTKRGDCVRGITRTQPFESEDFVVQTAARSSLLSNDPTRRSRTTFLPGLFFPNPRGKSMKLTHFLATALAASFLLLTYPGCAGTVTDDSGASATPGAAGAASDQEALLFRFRRRPPPPPMGTGG